MDKVIMWCDRRIDEMSKDELIDVVRSLGDQLKTRDMLIKDYMRFQKIKDEYRRDGAA